jgi:signal transduction histidine kinase
MAETIALLDRLRQDPIETIGLVEALRRQCEALGYQTSAEVTTTFGTLPDGNRVPPGAMKSVFRIAQEALANVARHARAMHVQLDVGRNDADDELVLRIRDDGQGFDTSSPASGMGISNMRERAAETGARLELQSKPGEGTAVALHLPLLDPREESLRRHQRLLLAVTTPAVLLSWAAFRWPLWRPHVLPPLMLTVAVAGYQAWRLVRLQWR